MKGFGIKRTALFLLTILSSSSALSLPAEYEQSLRPNHQGVSDVVNVSMYIIAVREVNENDQEITLDFFLRTFWVDPRLAGLVERDTVYVNKIPDVWLPDLFIVNSVNSQNPEKNSRSLKLRSDGSVAYSERLSAKISCLMSFVKFPFDKQSCRMDINSFGYTTVHLYLTWHGMTNEEISMFDPEYKIYATRQQTETVKTSTGEYHNLSLEVSFYRCGLGYLRRAMLPVFFFGLLSYLTFFMRAKRSKIEEDSVPSEFAASSTIKLVRMALNGLMMLLVVLVAQMNYINSPDTSAITALDVWMGVVGSATFIALSQSIHIYFVQWKRSLLEEKDDGEIFAEKVDRLSIIVFPIVFITFAVIYFAVYLT